MIPLLGGADAVVPCVWRCWGGVWEVVLPNAMIQSGHLGSVALRELSIALAMAVPDALMTRRGSGAAEDC